MNKETNFIRKAQNIYGDKYDYSKVRYINSREKVIIICSEHGEFSMLPFNHLNGQGCPKCSGRGMDKSLFVEKACKVHRNKYDYSKVEYKNSKTKVCIICPEHGEFLQAPSKHLYGRGCPKCAIEKRSVDIKMNYDEFVKKANGIHENKYRYCFPEDLVNMHSKVRIICPEHGEFVQLAYDHLSGHGCSKCGFIESKGENELYDYISGIIGKENVIRSDREVLDGKEIDIYIPSLKIGFEYNGLRWHSEEFNKDSKYHLLKTDLCNQKGIKLVQIFEDEYQQHKEIVLEKIRHLLGESEGKLKVYGRKCVIKEIDKKKAKEFLEKYHIQGYGDSSICLSACYDDNVVAVMAFKKEPNNNWELTRFASDYNYVCCGIGGKLFNYFIERYKPNVVKSFADRRWTVDEDNLYIKLGFKLDKILKPDYRYVCSSKPIERFHKFNFRKQILNKKYGLSLDMTENEMVKELGYVKVWDCGLYRYIWKNGR